MDVGTSEPVYASGADTAPDSDFEVGDLRHLVTGRRGRLLDPRRTPVEVSGVDMARGFFEVEILAFEDTGARWLVPFESVDNYQFAPGPEAPDDVVAAMREVVTALDRPLTVPADPDARACALRRLSEERIHAQRWLDDAGVTAVDLDPLVRTRSGDPALCARWPDTSASAAWKTWRPTSPRRTSATRSPGRW